MVGLWGESDIPTLIWNTVCCWSSSQVGTMDYVWGAMWSSIPEKLWSSELIEILSSLKGSIISKTNKQKTEEKPPQQYSHLNAVCRSTHWKVKTFSILIALKRPFPQLLFLLQEVMCLILLVDILGETCTQVPRTSIRGLVVYVFIYVNSFFLLNYVDERDNPKGLWFYTTEVLLLKSLAWSHSSLLNVIY